MRYATLLLINDIPFLLFGLCRDRLGYFCELFGCKFELFSAEIDIFLAVHGYKVYVRMRNLEAEHYHCHLFAS